MTEHVPGQLGMVPDDVDDQVAAVAAELDRLRELRTLQARAALSGVDGAAVAWRRSVVELDAAVAAARAAGASWEQIGGAAGLTRQAAWKRWGNR